MVIADKRLFPQGFCVPRKTFLNLLTWLLEITGRPLHVPHQKLFFARLLLYLSRLPWRSLFSKPSHTVCLWSKRIKIRHFCVDKWIELNCFERFPFGIHKVHPLLVNLLGKLTGLLLYLQFYLRRSFRFCRAHCLHAYCCFSHKCWASLTYQQRVGCIFWIFLVFNHNLVSFYFRYV